MLPRISHLWRTSLLSSLQPDIRLKTGFLHNAGRRFLIQWKLWNGMSSWAVRLRRRTVARLPALGREGRMCRSYCLMCRAA